MKVLLKVTNISLLYFSVRMRRRLVSNITSGLFCFFLLRLGFAGIDLNNILQVSPFTCYVFEFIKLPS